MWRSSDACGFAKMTALNTAKQEIRAIIAGSSVPEDPIHAENTLQWLLKIKPDADDALQIAALAHDIDRASDKKVKRDDYEDYDEFKAAHAKHGANILRGILEAHDVCCHIVDKACHLVLHHEVGGDPEADVLKDADSISYFDSNLPLYYGREGWQETKRRCVWGYRRLSHKMRKVLPSIKHQEKKLNQMLQEVINEFETQDTIVQCPR